MSEKKYTKDHEWVLLEENTATVGISNHAQESLGDIVFIELPEIGKQVKCKEEICVIESVKAAQECPNIYLETCTSYGDHGTIEYFVDSLGDDRILYGSDVPLIDPRFGVGRIATANISTESKRKILGLNALKVLNLKESEVIG